MLVFGVIVEGDFDAATLPEFIRKCVGDGTEVVSRVCGGKSVLMRKFPAFLESFRHAKQGLHVDSAFIIRDADNKAPQELLRALRDRYHTRNYPFPVQPVIIVQELETWLLADNEALAQVTGRRIAEIAGSLEQIEAPKTILQNILSDARMAYTPQVARQIAMAVSLEKLAYRCPSFRTFRQILRSSSTSSS